MTLSLQLDAALEKRLELAAGSAGVSTSEFVRQCLEEKLGPEVEQACSPPGNSRRALELGKHLIGAFDSGRTDVSQNDEEILRDYFDAKRRGAD